MAPPYDIQERTFEFSVQVVLFCRHVMRGDQTLGLLARQPLKAATSVGANMEEADGGQTKPDFITKVSIAKKEAKEAVYWLRLLAAIEPPLRQRLSPLLDEAKQIASIVSAIQLKAETNRKRTATVLTLLVLRVRTGCLRFSTQHLSFSIDSDLRANSTIRSSAQ